MEMNAVVSGVEPFGLFAQGVELPASGFIPVDSLPGDKYRFDRSTRTLLGFRKGNQFRLGDPIRVRVVSADPDRREIEYALITNGKSRSGKSRRQQKPADGGKSTSLKKNGKSPRKHR